MSLPSKGTRGRLLLEYLYQVDHKQIEGLITDLSDSLTRTSARIAITQMCERGQIVNLSVQELSEDRRTQFSDIVALTQSTRYELEDEQEAEKIAANPVELVQPPTRNVFGPAISAKNIPSAKGMRDGSNDHLSWNRRHV